jgi:hypothetical protein
VERVIVYMSMREALTEGIGDKGRDRSGGIREEMDGSSAYFPTGTAILLEVYEPTPSSVLYPSLSKDVTSSLIHIGSMTCPN